MLSVAMKGVFRTALTAGATAVRNSPTRPAAGAPGARAAVPGGVEFARAGVRTARLGRSRRHAVPLDPGSPLGRLPLPRRCTLTGTVRLADALNHLYVLLPVLDDAKHYWVSTDEVDKLLRAGGGWLAGHPERTLITRRYLAHRRELTPDALARLAEVDDADAEELDNSLEPPRVHVDADRPVPLNEQRRGAVLAALRASGARTRGRPRLR